MTLIDTFSLNQTLDAIQARWFAGEEILATERREAALWIASRQGLKGAYARMFAPTPQDYAQGVRVFTGERVTSGAATGHVMGEEACRALLLLGVDDPQVSAALEQARAGILERLGEGSFDQHGRYCCGTCTAALWRHISAGAFPKNETWLSAGLATLKRARLAGGKWRTYPFFYTVLALSGIDHPAALEELRYAAPALERSLKRKTADEVFSQRRAALAERVLNRL